jgi:hypothetical protein
VLKNLTRGGILKSGVQGGMAGLSLLLLVVHAADSGNGPHAESGPVSSAPSRMAQASQRAEFGHEPASAQARDVAHWVMASGDHQGRPFVVVDKIHARVFVFDRRGHLLGAASALLGLQRGDEAVKGLGDRPLSLVQPHERITPAGRFVAELDHNVLGQAILWLDYEQAISLHPVRSVNPKERRLQRLASPAIADKRISYGCINVPTQFWGQVVEPAFRGTQGLVYVLPELRSLGTVFKDLDSPTDAAVVK